MEKSLLLGNEAVARAAYDAGAAVASAYPGTPSTEITENLAKYPDIYCEWAPNEKVALETALGASIAGARAICAMKHVGLNVAADPLFTASYTGVNGGLVIMAADDPGMHSSQNEQDSRYYGLSAKVPVLEPADSQECYDFVKAAFELSERFDTPVIVRLTTRVAHSRSLVAAAPGSGAGGATGRGPVPLKPYRKDVGKYVMMPAMARGRHVEVEKRMRALGEYAETCAQNTIGGRDGAAACASGGAAVDASASGGAGSSSGRAVKKAPFGVITSGMAWQYTREALGESDVPILKLGLVHPLPKQKITDFAARVDRLAVVEELSPFIEDFVKGLGVPVTGKSALPEIGELSAALVSGALKTLGKDESGAPAAASDSAAPASAPVSAVSTPKSASASSPSASASPADAAPAPLPARPPVLCPGCPHRSVFYVLKRLKLTVCGDIGCYTLGALPPLEAMDTCVCMGASIGVAHGMNKARGVSFAQKTVAVIGDSTFLHSGITGLIDVVYNKGDTTVLILDNSITGMTGHQQNPATGYTIRGEETHCVDLEALCRAVGVPSVRIVDPFDIEALETSVREETQRPGPSVIIVRRPCALISSYKPESEVWIDPAVCSRCKMCMGISCAAISDKDGRMEINAALCARCGLCARICKFGAIKKRID